MHTNNSNNSSQEIKPWDEEINGENLFSEISNIFKDFIKLKNEEADALTGWVIQSYFVRNKEQIQLLEYLPILNISSPERQCGKSTLKDIIYELVPRPINTENCSEASLFRLISSKMPTLLIDESENFISKPELRTILNGGYQKKGVVHRQGGKNYEETIEFSTWCAKCIVGIGTLHDTLQSRCITIRLKRKLNTDNVLRKNLILKSEPDFFINYKRKILRFVQENEELILKSEIEMPLELDDRSQNNWEGIFKISQFVSNSILTRVKSASIVLNKLDHDDQSEGIQLLKDLRDLINESQTTNLIPSMSITSELNKLLDRPWNDLNRGSGINQNQLARLLKPFDIFPKQLKIEGKNIRGYEKIYFEDAFLRYL